MKKPRKCRACGETGHRADHCPQQPRTGTDGPGRAREAEGIGEATARLIAAAEGLGETKCRAAVERATAEVLARDSAMRLELIKSRAENRKLRHALGRSSAADARQEAKDLARLDREEKEVAQRDLAGKHSHL